LTDVLSSLSIAGLLVYLYWPSRQGEFLFDDLPLWNVVEKVRLVPGEARFPWQAFLDWKSQSRSLALWTLKNDVISHDPQLGRDESDQSYRSRIAGWHDRNIALHVLCAVILYAILRYWFPVGPALLGALCASAHPLCTATGASIVGRYGLLCAGFYLSSILAFLLGLWWLIPALAYCGWRCKQDIVALPFALIVIWYWS
jgi:hypothetical protein